MHMRVWSDCIARDSAAYLIVESHVSNGVTIYSRFERSQIDKIAANEGMIKGNE